MARDDLGRKVGSNESRGADDEDAKRKLSRFDSIAGLMSDLRCEISDVRPRDVRFEYEQYRIGLARHAVGRDERDRYPNPRFGLSSGPLGAQDRQFSFESGGSPGYDCAVKSEERDPG
ncbi:MAG: hypothetical protein O7F76_10695 [Planctomycetota bacterium]|nr:hypothetical protein [Planctomycetota bacterium]